MDFTIADVIDLLGIERLPARNENQIPIVCPYCGDRRGKNTARLEKSGKPANVFHCWACGKGGNMLELYVDCMGGYSGAGCYKQAYRDIAERLSASEYKARYARREPKKPKVKCARLAPMEVRDKTYRTMLSFLPLKGQDKQDLSGRMLSEAEIKAGLFASTPYDTVGICRKLKRVGCELEGVPGFFINEDKEWQLNVSKNAGYFCPVFHDGLIAGMQIRLRNPFDGQKYIWLSSADKPHGVSSGAPCTSLGKADAERLIITEGTLKSYITYQMIHDRNTAVIGVPGVSCINELAPVLKRHHHKVVFEAFDMDKAMDLRCMRDYDHARCTDCIKNGYSNYDRACGLCVKKSKKDEMLKKSIVNLEKVVKSCGYGHLYHYVWDQGPNGIWLGHYKGIDDYLAAEKRGCKDAG